MIDQALHTFWAELARFISDPAVIRAQLLVADFVSQFGLLLLAALTLALVISRRRHGTR